MLRITVEIDWLLLGLVAALGAVLASLYAAALSTKRGKQLCRERTHWTVIIGHLLMALTMCLVSPPIAGLWLLWSVVHGLPLVIRSEALRWRLEKRREEANLGALRGVVAALRDVVGTLYETDGAEGGPGAGGAGDRSGDGGTSI